MRIVVFVIVEIIKTVHIKSLFVRSGIMGKTQTEILPEWVKWVSQDADGAVWGYECEPHQYHKGWYENEVGRSIKISMTKANSNWYKSLKRIG